MDASSFQDEAGKLRPVDGHTRTWNATWQMFYEIYKQTILDYSRSRGLDEHAANDVLQEVVSAVIRSQNTQPATSSGKQMPVQDGDNPTQGYDPARGPFRGWIWGIIKKSVSQAWRRRMRTPLATVLENEDGTPTDPGIFGIVLPPDHDDWERAIFEVALKRVKNSSRDVCIAVIKEQLTAKEAAKALNCSVDAFFVRKHNFLADLKQECLRIQKEWERRGL